MLDELLDAVDVLLATSDDTGCDGTVVVDLAAYNILVDAFNKAVGDKCYHYPPCGE